MPLSDHEQRLLDQMERALYAEDPKFVSNMAAVPRRLRLRRRLIAGLLVLLLGVAMVILGVISQQVWLGAIGFVVMVAGGAFAFAPTTQGLGVVDEAGRVTPAQSGGVGASKKRFARPNRASGSFMQRLEERWDRRRHEDTW